MKISEYPEQSALSGNDLLLIWDSTALATKYVKLSNLKTFLGSTTSETSDKVLTYVSNEDTNGIVYWLGTGKGTRNFANPHDSADLTISASSIGSGTLSELVNRIDGQFFTNSVANSWVALSLPPNTQLEVNNYSLKTRNASSEYYPRSWNLQGSNDNSNWIDLDVQVNNATLTQNSQWLTLPVPTANRGFYRFHRIYQTGINSSGHHHLVLGEIELYGIYRS